jgi:hypothetical protein
MFFWVVTPCRLVGRYQHFGETYRLHLQGFGPTSSHGVTTHKNKMFRIAFWDVLPCKMIVDRGFRGAYCLHHQGWVRRTTSLSLLSWDTDISHTRMLNIAHYLRCVAPHVSLCISRFRIKGNTSLKKSRNLIDESYYETRKLPVNDDGKKLKWHLRTYSYWKV